MWFESCEDDSEHEVELKNTNEKRNLRRSRASKKDERHRGGDGLIPNLDWKFSVSTSMKAVIHYENYHKNKVLNKLKNKLLSKNDIYFAFEKYGRLLRGFRRFQRRVSQKRSKLFHKRKLLTSTFQTWVEYHQTAPIVPASRGCFVSACFRWIGFSFLSAEPKYYLNWIQHTQLLSSQTRNYVFGHLNLPKKRIPLFLHAIGIHDAYRIRSTFFSWAHYALKIRTFRLKISFSIEIHFLPLLETSHSRCAEAQKESSFCLPEDLYSIVTIFLHSMDLALQILSLLCKEISKHCVVNS